jgi:hypothetical protein
MSSLHDLSRDPGEAPNAEASVKWIPACAGMTKERSRNDEGEKQARQEEKRE